jgi:DNA-binding response OmpR family regulator
MRVLLVEDSKPLAEWVSEGLRDQGMAVDVSHDGRQAANMIGTTAYNVIVLDRDLPGLHGDTLCRMVAESESEAMILMLTASTSPGERVAGLGLGADDYLGKPFHFPELVMRIRALARRQPAAPSRVLRAGDIELDPSRHLVTRSGQALNLSAKEFGLLEALMRAERACVSAHDLLEQVWDEHADPFTNTVLVTMSRLRRKLGEPDVIETIPNVGYRMRARSEATVP